MKLKNVRFLHLKFSFQETDYFSFYVYVIPAFVLGYFVFLRYMHIQNNNNDL